jgi:hypothetical protein
MILTKSETNNAVITRLQNVRKHPNADRLKLATVFGTTVIVGLDAKDGDLVAYFDSNLCLSPEYMRANNLYSNKELNKDPTKGGYFGSSGRVRAQKFRGEMSNGYVAELNSFADFWSDNDLRNDTHDWLIWKEGTEFTHINGFQVCCKYVVPTIGNGYTKRNAVTRVESAMFKQHWDTKQLMRQYQNIPNSSVMYIEEKIHGTSGRTGHLLVNTYRPWWKFWEPKQKWAIISGTRRVNHITGHMPMERKEIEAVLAPQLHKGETVYYEIFGYQKSGAEVQCGFTYGCQIGHYKVMAYRITITTPDGFTFDLPRHFVYRRAEELGLMKPIVIAQGYVDNIGKMLEDCQFHAHGNSAIANHMKEGIVVWWQELNGTMNCLKHKSEEFYLHEDGLKEKNIGDVEDSI